MNITSDYHLHTSFSSDSETLMEEMIECGLKKGLTHMCFTEHMDRDFLCRTDEDPDFEVETAAYFQKYIQLKEKYQDRIKLLFGVELGLQPHVASFYQKYIKEYPFDFIIGSSHLCHRRDPYLPEFYEGREEYAAYVEYFESILENIRAYDGYDVYGHLDYTVRYGPNKNQFYTYEAYAEVIDAILRELIAGGKGIELNTGGFRYGLGQPNPSSMIIKRYRELGGEIITVGSDAHTPEYIAYEFERATDLLRICGFRYYSLFKKRRAEYVKL